MGGARFAIFLSTVLAIWAGMHAYVFWRAGSVPWIAAHVSRRALILTAVVLWASYPVARILDSWSERPVTWPLEFLAACWVGVLFLCVAAMLVADVATLGGWLTPRLAGTLRGGALLLAIVLALIGVVQAVRKPVVREYEVRLPGLPPAQDGLVVVQISDLHLGTLLGSSWLKQLVDQVNGLEPDLIVAVGDIVDGNVRRVEPFVPILKGLKAPLGVWAVTGNHEFYAGLDRSVQLLTESGFELLRDRWVTAAPGLVLAGVDDLTARQQMGLNDGAIEAALSNRPVGAAILLSHSP
ncbi:MAG TPA: metallophosphoesterase, partial [Clostridia bacterium]|nr:metallophosphoesterase [Clostridia bacterium]